MAFGHSKQSEFYFDTTDLTGYLTSIDLSEDHQVADTTVLNDDWKTYIRGQGDATLSLEGIFDPTLGTLIESYGTVVKAFEYFPQGSATGLTYASGSAWITSKSVPSAMDSAVTWSADLQVSGGITWGTVA